MSDRRKVLALFEEQKDFLQDKIHTGIEQNRKGYAYITVTDNEGNVVPNAKIRVSQKNHEFRFGANIFLLDEMESDEKNQLYKEYFIDVFNMATLPFYWDATEPRKGETRYEKNSEKLYRRPAIDLCMEFCEEHGIEPREHALAYEQFFPTWLYDASVAEVKRAMEKRYQEISERYAGKIQTIEVTNEMNWSRGKTTFYEEEDFIEYSFKLAEKYFPTNELVVNECTDLAWGDTYRTTDKYYAYIQANLLKGARIDAIGMQFHMMYDRKEQWRSRIFYNPELLYKHMDLYSKFGKPLQVTEVTVPAYSNDEEDELLQAEILEILYSIWFSHPNMEQIIYWNLVDGYAHLWNPSLEAIKASQGDMTLGENRYYGGLIRFDMTPKPAYYAIKNLIQKKWHTETEVITGNNGLANFKGFYGEYDVEIEVDGKISSHVLKLSSKRDNKFQYRCDKDTF